MKKAQADIEFDSGWRKDELKVFAKLTTPAKIQTYLDKVPYNSVEYYRSPRMVLEANKADCGDGALFAAAALRRLGHSPRIVCLLAQRDDSHVIALYEQNGRLGALAKSNCTGLRFREPVYLNLRELIMSYFNDYFNTKSQKSLRAYSAPLSLMAFDKLNWMTDDRHLARIGTALDRQKYFQLLTKKMVAALEPVDPRSYKAGFLGSVLAGLYKP